MEHHGASRRELLKMTAAGMVAIVATPETMFAQNAKTASASPETPEEAVRLLLQGNERYMAYKPGECVVDLAELRRATKEEQRPFAAILACADSRLPVEIIFAKSIGQLFVVRVAGNIAAPDTIASLEYAAEELGIKTILVLGHSGCGAVKATKAGGAVPGQISELFQYIYPATVGTEDLQAAVEKNARLQAAILRGSSPDIVKLIESGKLSVEAAVYDLDTGKVKLLEALKL